MTGDEEIFHYKLLCLLSHFLQLVPVGKKVPNAQRRPFRGIDQEAGVVVVHLESYTTHFSADHRFPFPHCFCDGEAETLLGGFLHHDV